MIEQTLFALPFALIGVLFAGGGSVRIWVLTLVALVAARTAGMSYNRVIDAEIDAKNLRTRDRLVPKGEVPAETVWGVAGIASLILIGTAYLLNDLCFYLSFAAVFLLFSYSYFKRFSASSHFYLGLVEAAAPIGGYLAVTGGFTLVPFVLGFAILTWIAGLDIVYALQDLAFDRNEKLHSIPVRVGRKNALRLSAVCYIFSLGAMIFAGFLAHRAFVYWIALVLIGLIFFSQQKLARSDDVAAGIKMFLRINMLISPILFFGTLMDVLIV